ncbi:MAG: DUF4124 domain-containing protein [Gammaproteobacteria bacterium]|nr:DUF4124 domain-containing protein [Gammaproteobacteria bacterium]
MRHSSSSNSRLCLLLLLCIGGMSASAEVYRWTDAEGRAHFGDRPPLSGARSVDVPANTGSPAPTPAERLEKQRALLRAFEEERRQHRDVREKTQHDKAERQRNCVQARDRLQSYEHSSGIYDLDAQGERVFLDDTQREQFMAERRQDVETWCGKP